MRAYLNGQFLPLSEARISPLDRGFLFGDGVYEVIPVYDGKPFLLTEHLNRLDRSLAAIDIKNTPTHAQWIDIIKDLSAHAPTPNHGVYLHITRGAGTTRAHQYTDDLQPTVFAMTIAIRLLSAHDKQQGLTAITANDNRWGHCYIKSLNLLPNILALQHAAQEGAYETIFIKDGYLTEGTGSNIFIVKNNIIITPPQTPQILWGITRGFVLRLAQTHQLAYEERIISEEELNNADEIWITSSTREVVPITRLNGKNVGNGAVGLVWKKIDQYFKAARE
jgi:D-alanine transaminase